MDKMNLFWSPHRKSNYHK